MVELTSDTHVAGSNNYSVCTSCSRGTTNGQRSADRPLAVPFGYYGLLKNDIGTKVCSVVYTMHRKKDVENLEGKPRVA